MLYKWGLVLFSLMSTGMCMNPKARLSEVRNEHNNALYFEATVDKQFHDQNARDRSSVVTLPNSSCDDPKFSCAANLTCCDDDMGTYTCCPIPYGICCDDGIHCCPPNTQCDVDKQQCYYQNKDGYKSIAANWIKVDRGLMKEQLTQKVSPPDADVVCPGGALSCPEGSTCCQQSAGSYECCPLPKAVCCSDHVHCCPNGYACNVSAGTCTKGNDKTRWLTKVPAKPAINSVECEDESACPSGSSCCELTAGSYGCCPMKEAVCCLDHTHCCPKDYKCDVSRGTCTRSSNVISWLRKHPTKPVEQWIDNSVVCPGGQAQCPDGTTCCKMQSGAYGCCPYSKAVCCSDELHCCPDGYTCDVSAGMCVRGSDILNWLTKIPATPAKASVTCEDLSVCSSGSTCCESKSDQYGCCPLEQAVCCSDHIHCCPNGYQCDVSTGTCTSGSDILSWLTKKPSRP